MLTPEQMRRIEPYFSAFAWGSTSGRPAGAQRHPVRDPQWSALAGCSCWLRPTQTIYNRFIRWSRLGVFNRILAELAARGGSTDKLMIDATHLKAHRTAASLLKKGLYPDVSDAAEAG